MGQAMLHLAIVFAEMERDLVRERKRAEEIQQMRRRDGLSWGRIATITGLPSSSIRRICIWNLRRDSADCLRGLITGPPGSRRIWPEPRGLGDDGTGFREMFSVVAKI